MTKLYRLELTEGQARAIMQACDTLARLGMGQLASAVLDNTQHLPGYVDGLAEARDVLHQIVNWMGGGAYFASGGPSIHNPLVPNAHRAAFDVVQVIRHQFYTEGLDTRPIASSEPFQCGDEPVPKIIVTEAGQE
jgi:hypothetical protein